MAPDMVFAYNFPALGLWRVIKYCKKKGIKVIGDITEWYKPYNIFKRMDTYWRMEKLNKQTDGLIFISKYLESYYKGVNSFYMPPTVNSEEKRSGATLRYEDIIVSNYDATEVISQNPRLYYRELYDIAFPVPLNYIMYFVFYLKMILKKIIRL